MNTQKLISFVIPVYNEEEVLPQLILELEKIIKIVELKHEVEICFIDDGSLDNSWLIIEKKASNDIRFKGIRLSRNFGHQRALTCGYNFARGDAVICLDADLQDPPEIATKMITKWEEGADIVYAVREKREKETAFKLITANLFYRLIDKITNSRQPQNCGDFRLMSKSTLDVFNKMPEQHRYIRGMVGWIGFQSTVIYYKRNPRAAGKTKYPFYKMVRLAIDAIVSMSYTPIRLAYIIGIIIAIPFILYLGRALIKWKFFNAELEKGWVSLLLCIITFGIANLFFIGILGEYIGRIYEESKKRPLYIVSDQTKNNVEN